MSSYTNGSSPSGTGNSAIVNTTGKTRLLQSLERAKAGGQPSIGQWMEFPGYTLARTIAGLGSDWVLIDCEHGNIADHEMYLAIGAITTAGSSPIVRIASNQDWMMKRALDTGAHGIMVPMVEDEEQAKAVVQGMKYPSSRWPQGQRGCGAMFASDNFNQDGRQYLETANDNILIIVQIESRKGLENVEGIAGVDGIDMLFIGPNDLASSMGYFAFDHESIPEVQEAKRRILKAGKAKGKFVGGFALGAESAAKLAEEGFEFMNCGADIVAITKWMGDEMGKLRSLLQEAENVEVAGENQATEFNPVLYSF